MEREPKIVRVLFNDDMARAIVQGRKTATRRPPRHSIRQSTNFPGQWEASDNRDLWWNLSTDQLLAKFAPCAPGDILIGRECWCELRPEHYEDASKPRGAMLTRYATRVNGVAYRCETDADGDEIRRGYGYKWRPSIHMPDWAARIRRRVVSVTVERLQDIDEDEAAREGFSAQVTPRMTGMPDLPGEGEPCDCGDVDCPLSARMEFACAWISIYAAKGLGWDVNPWVWRIEFASKNVPAA